MHARGQRTGGSKRGARMRPTHRTRVVVLAFLLVGALLSPLACALALEADAEAGANPRTGNAWIDARLIDMDAYAARYRDAFVDEIVRYHEAPRALVEEALADGAMTAGDVYYACALAQATGRPCRAVVDAWRGDAGQGWEGVAGRLGVAQLAGIHRRIRGDIAESYVRWARPIDAGAPPKR